MWALAGGLDEPEPGWRLGEEHLVELPDGQIARCRVVNVIETGTIQVVPEHDVVIGRVASEGSAEFGCVRSHLEREAGPCQHGDLAASPRVTSSTRGTPMGTSRYDRFSEVGNREYEESRALHIIADLVRDYPGVESVSLRGSMSEVIRQVAIELGNGRPVPVGLRRAVLRMADLLRNEMQPSGN